MMQPYHIPKAQTCKKKKNRTRSSLDALGRGPALTDICDTLSWWHTLTSIC